MTLAKALVEVIDILGSGPSTFELSVAGVVAYIMALVHALYSGYTTPWVAGNALK